MSSSQRVDPSGFTPWLPASVLGGARPDSLEADAAPSSSPSFQKFTRLGYAAMTTIISAALWTAWMGDTPETPRTTPPPPPVVAPPVTRVEAAAPEARTQAATVDEEPRPGASAARPARRKHARARPIGQRGIRSNPY